MAMTESVGLVGKKKISRKLVVELGEPLKVAYEFLINKEGSNPSLYTRKIVASAVKDGLTDEELERFGILPGE
ncbi:MAG: hypothetical protein AAF518_20455 [Spirochaetota bacterium]